MVFSADDELDVGEDSGACPPITDRPATPSTVGPRPCSSRLPRHAREENLRLALDQDRPSGEIGIHALGNAIVERQSLCAVGCGPRMFLTETFTSPDAPAAPSMCR